MSVEIVRPNGKVYRPRKISATSVWMDDEPVAVYVFGTHDTRVALPHAEEIVRELNESLISIYGEDALLVGLIREPLLRWIGTTPGRDEEGGIAKFFKDDEERGRATVAFPLDLDVEPDEGPRPDGIMPPALDGIGL